jgi:glycosyltransferase involved in cell wall biosynthesis
MMVQMGARRNYVYASQLEQAGLLHSLVTDIAWPAGQRQSWLVKSILRVRPSMAGAVARRQVKSVDRKRIRSSLLPTLALGLKKIMHAERAYLVADFLLAALAGRRSLTSAKVLVNYHGNGGPLLRWAKRCGVKIATDFIITPRYLEIEHAERVRWQDWEAQTTDQSTIDLYRQKMVGLLAISDIYLCPSPGVARDLGSLPGFDPAKVRLAPYGMSGVDVSPSQPEIGRVLFVGEAGLRKGIPYLAQAASLLRMKLPECQIYVAGHVGDKVRNRPETANLHFLGPLNRAQLADEYARADLLCLPSLAEGSATTAFEAMANGLPIITTVASGTMVNDGIEGLIVPERDGTAIASAIETIVCNRPLRATMSQASFDAADQYSDKACGSEFIKIINELIVAQPNNCASSHG